MKPFPWKEFRELMGSLLLFYFVWQLFAYHSACTPAQRAIVRTVVDLVEEVCGDKDTVEECLGKAQAKREAMRREAAGAAAHDAGAGDGG